MARLSHSIAILTKLQVSCIFILLTTVIPNVEARTHYLTWKVTYEYKYLDCFKKLAIAINGQTPGPHINATRGDTIIVTVLNNLLMENVAIHWHGIRQVAC
jgi:FtsP/CotA-like multicopper oxidase with cupredoxin domain